MSLSKTLWQANQDLVAECLQHPFVQGIGDGSLPKANFAYYVAQDAFFLEAFARAYSISAAKSPDWGAFKTFHDLAEGVLTELEMHRDYATSWGVNISSVTPATATRQYTDFLLSTAWSQPLGVTAVAMSPCMRLYVYLGQQLAAEGIPNHSYKNWVETYSSSDFEPLAEALEAIVNEYSSDTPLVRSTYRYAMTCERDFFQAALNS